MKQIAVFLALLPMLGCGTPDVLVPVNPATSTERVQARSGSVEIIEVSLPSYASSDALAVVAADGTLLALPNTVWADDPERAMTAALVRNLGAITDAQVAASPWPLLDIPEAELTVRVEQMLVDTRPALILTGQYAIGREEGRQIIKPFEITVPVVGEGTAQIARAHANAWTELSEMIARDL